MKKLKSLHRQDRVFYFEHRHGVVKKKQTSKKYLLGSMVSAFMLIAGLGTGINAALSYRSANTTPSYEREAATTAPAQTATESADKLKSASTKAREDAQLAKEIKSKLRNVPGGQKWSVYVRDLNSDRMASINADDQIDATGGLANLFTVAPLEAKLPSSNWGYKAGKQTVAQCVQQMINSNDQDCAKIVKQYANFKAADNVNASLGFKKTTLNGKTPQTTAREAGDLLYRLQNSQVLSDKGRRTVFDGLYGQKSRDGISAACTQKCLVANVTTDTNGTRSDAAIVTTGNAKYVVVMVTNGASWSQIADVAASIRTTMQP